MRSIDLDQQGVVVADASDLPHPPYSLVAAGLVVMDLMSRRRKRKIAIAG
jgi:hypothetical protein